MHFVLHAISIILPLWASEGTKGNSPFPVGALQRDLRSGNGVPEPLPSHSSETSYTSPVTSAGWLVEMSLFYPEGVVFTVKDKGSQKLAEMRRRSKVLQAHFNASGPCVFVFTITNECVCFTSTLVN
uniref:Secreted protein n=1 Tax=Molossus molossus TaxID=27622 RepID=A0A7J8JX31_MOLMO|nr:hypothetical protein HJG59_007917 [Molossus molossus]